MISGDTLTAEPEQMVEDGHMASSSVRPGTSDGQRRNGPHGPQKWSEENWTKEILEQSAIPHWQSKIELRINQFRERASTDEWKEIEASRAQMTILVEEARKAHDTRNPNRDGKTATIRENIKKGLNDAAQVTFTYVQMLDVMVSQAPELVAIAYGAVKIILAVQVNLQEVKEKVPAFMKRASAKFEALDHLTAYRPSRNLVSAISQAYQLYIKFLAKAVKLYTECRAKRLLKATIHPWKNRFQSIVDGIEEIFSHIHEVSQHHNDLETHLGLQATSQVLNIVRNQQSNGERMLALLERLSQMIPVNFNKAEDIRETATAVRQQVDEVMDQPCLERQRSQPPTENGTDLDEDDTNPSEIIDRVLNDVFTDLAQEESLNDTARRTRAIMEFPSMQDYKPKQKGQLKSEKLISWLQSPVSQLLWLDGNKLLTASDCNMLFTNPLILAAEGSFDSALVLRHRYEEKASAGSYVALAQSLISQSLRKNLDIFPSIHSRMKKETATDLGHLWDLLITCFHEIDASCVLIIIDGIDKIGIEQVQLEEEFVNQLDRVMNEPELLVKVLITTTLRKEERVDMTVSMKALHSQMVRRSPVRTLSVDGIQTDFPLLSHEIVRIQERKCDFIRFNQLPYLYSPGSTIFEWQQSHLTACIISEVSGMEPTFSGGLMPLVLRVWQVSHNEIYFTKRFRDIRISQFHGERKTSSLKQIPAGYLPDEPKHRRRLCARGRRYWILGQGVHHMQITTASGSVRVIVDQTASSPQEIPAQEIADQYPEMKAADVRPGLLHICSHVLNVLVLQDFRWATSNVDDINDIIFPNDPFRRLHLPADQIELLKGVVKSNATGITILLHGDPGTGKSFTADCVADWARLPLVPLVVDRNEDSPASSLKQNVYSLFEVAKRCKGIVLIDHAELLLEKRTSDAGERNSLVVTTLRHLESFKGYVLLITDRADAFDEKAKSMISLNIEFERPQGILQRRLMHDFLGQLAIGENPLQRPFELDANEDEIAYKLMKIIDSGSGRGPSGRQIKAFFYSAALLAAKDPDQTDESRIRITLEHFKTVWNFHSR